MGLLNISIDGRQVQVQEGQTVLEAARSVGITIPSLCHYPGINATGVCRVCLVNIGGYMQASCVTAVEEGMEIQTRTPEVREARRTVLELLLSAHPEDCLQCVRSKNCELQTLAENMGIREIRYKGERRNFPVDDSNPSLIRDSDKCILCRRCVHICQEVQSTQILFPQNRGFDTSIAPDGLAPLNETACIYCGQCINVCPVGAITEKSYSQEVWEALGDDSKHVVVQTAPAIRVSLGEELGMEAGSIVTGQMVAALRMMGFDRVFDTDFTADLTIMEEGNELIERIKNKENLPLITSCSPGWIKFCEHHYPDFLANLSTCKSPQQMFGALAKTYYADKAGLDPENIVVVSIMPCTAKKFEMKRPGMNSSQYQDVDYVLTTRELGQMIREAGLDFPSLESQDFDNPLGISTGAGEIFGATGGVMEAALRTAYELLTGQELPGLQFQAARGLEGIKEAEIEIGELTLRIAVAHSLGQARKLLEMVRQGDKDYHFIEIMSCPGGCIGGGGQPISGRQDVLEKRMAAIYKEDSNMSLRKSHENPGVKALYDEFLGEPLGERSHHLLHTTYEERSSTGRGEPL